MSQQSAPINGENGQWLEFYKTLMSKKPTLVTNLDGTATIIINALSTLVGIYKNTQTRITWGGTSKTLFHGKMQSVIAGKLEDTIILEIRTKRENIEPQFPDHPYLYGRILNAALLTRTTEKSLYGLIVVDHPQRVLGATLCADKDALSVFLELKAMDTE